MQNINDQFFNGPYREVWRQLIPAGLTEAECDFIQEACSLNTGQVIADLMCGYGRHALELARRGHQVIAVDNDPVYINEVRALSEKDGLHVDATVMNVTEWKPAAPVSAILCMGNSFAFFPAETAKLLLLRISEALLTGGCFILNSWMIGEIAIRHFKEKEWHSLPGLDYLIRSRFHLQPSRIESDHIIMYPDAPPVNIPGVDHIFTISELDSMMASAGLRLESVYATPRKKKFILGDGRAYIVARKV